MCKQGLLLKEYPNKLLATLIQCLFGMVQSCLLAVLMERDHPGRWKVGLDLSLLAVAYSVSKFHRFNRDIIDILNSNAIRIYFV